MYKRPLVYVWIHGSIVFSIFVYIYNNLHNLPEKKDTCDGSDRLSALEAEVEHFNQIHLKKEMEYKAKVAQIELRLHQDCQEMASMM